MGGSFVGRIQQGRDKTGQTVTVTYLQSTLGNTFCYLKGFLIFAREKICNN